MAAPARTEDDILYADYVSKFKTLQIVEPKPRKGCCGRPPPPLKDGESEPLPSVPLLKMLWLLPTKYRVFMVFGSFFSMCHGVTFPVFSIAFGELFNIFFSTIGDVDALRAESATIAYIFVGLACYNLVIGYACQALWGLVGEALGLYMRRDFFAALIRQEVGYFDNTRSGRLVSMLSSDIEQIRSASGAKVSLCISFLTQIVAGVVIAFVYSWKLTLVLIAISPVMAAGSVLQMKMISKGSQSAVGVFGSASAFAAEVIQGFKTVASFVWQGEAHRRYEDKIQQADNPKEVHLAALGFGFSFFFMFLVYAMGFWWGSELIARGELMIGDFLIVFFSILIGAMGAGQLTTLLPDFAKGRGAAAAVVAVLQRDPLIDPNPQGIIDASMTPSIEFRDVRFSYPSRPDAPVLTGLSFQVAPGSTIGICGSSGAGKSTVVSLLERFYDPTSGAVLIGDVDMKEYNLHWLRKQIGLVSQEPILFDATIRENIIFGKINATQEEIEAAARDANAHDFIMELPQGYDTLVGEQGGQLSGGQKQRVAIARAILKNPKILLLDEATSALDSKSEATVQEALDRAMIGRTTIVIAHRLSTIKHSTQIVVMDEGNIAEMGSHWELLATKGLYYALVVRQMSPEELRELEDLLNRYISGEYHPESGVGHAAVVNTAVEPIIAEDLMAARQPSLAKEWEASKWESGAELL